MTTSSHPAGDGIAAHFAEAVAWRRDLHRNAQPAWLEFYATAYVAEKLAGWGYDLRMGRDVIAADKQLLAPAAEALEAEYRRALAAGVDEKYLAPARGGFTGVVATIQGEQPGPTVGFRFDIDSNEVLEDNAAERRPVKEGFVSQNPGYAHMCGHDAHSAMGLLLARHFAEKRDSLRGAVKFIFQPNEENLSGAAAMIAMGVADDLDYLLGGHVGLGATRLGQLALNVHSFMALKRFEVTFIGRPTHAALRPNEGNNALLGACAAITHLYAIARHGLGASRINVGTLKAGTTWNVIPDKAFFQMETRGVSNEINDYMVDKAMEVIAGAAKMYGLEYRVAPAATASSAENSPELVELGNRVAKTLSWVAEVIPSCAFNASEDVTLFMEHVRQRGGQALYALFGTPVGGGHHNAAFDIDETVIRHGAEFLAAMHAQIVKPGG